MAKKKKTPKKESSGEYVFTRKIEIQLNTGNEEERKAFYAKIFKWQQQCFACANLTASHLHTVYASAQMVYYKEKAKPPEDGFDDKAVYKMMTDHTASVLNVSPQGAMYQMLAAVMKTEHMPSAIMSCLATNVYKTFIKELPDLRMGKKSLRTYKEGMPIPFTAVSIINVSRKDWIDPIKGTEWPNFQFTLFGVPFKTRFGIDPSNNHHFFEQAMSMWFLPEYIWKMEKTLSERMVLAEENIRENHKNVGEVKPGEKPKKAKQLRPLYLELLNNTPNEKEFTVKHEDQTYNCQLIKSSSTNWHYRITAMRGGVEHVFKMEPCERDGKRPTDTEPAKEGKPAWKIVSDIDLGDSSIVLTRRPSEKDANKTVTKMFLLAVLKKPREQVKLDENKTAYVRLAVDSMITVTIDGKEYRVGDQGMFIKKRMIINNALREVQRSAKVNNRGRGRGHMMKYPDHYKKVEADYVKNTMHKISREIITLCLQFECKYLVLVNQKAIEVERDSDKLKLRYWSLGGLKSLVLYKANVQGMIVSEDGKEDVPEAE